MTTLYSLRTQGPSYSITKFDPSGNPESTYEVSRDACTCPAGHRHTCRHRMMLGNLLPLVDTHYFWDYDRGMAVDFQGLPKSLYDQPADAQRYLALPEGMNVLVLDDPGALHNTIAEAVGEPLSEDWSDVPTPEESLKPHSPEATTADFDSADTGSNPVGVATPAKSWRRL